MILVTGATGFLGGHLVEALVARGQDVVAMARESSDTSLLDALGVEVRRGDVTDRESLRNVTAGVDTIFHLAAYYTFHGRWELYRKVNIEGTRTLLEESSANGVRRFIHCSSTEAMGPTTISPAGEEGRLAPAYDYGRSKAESETIAMAFADRMDVTVVRPSGIYGPRNLDDVSYYFIKSFAGPMSRFIIGDGKALIQFVHVDDVVQGLLLSLDHSEAIGETFIITDGRAYSYEEVYAIMAEVMGRSPPRWHLPAGLAKLLIAPVEGINHLRGKEDFIMHLDTVDAVTRDRHYSIGKARRVLGFEPRHDLKEGLRQTVEWYRENGVL